MRVVYMGKKFKAIRSRRDYLVVRIENDCYSQHGHFKYFRSARKFVNLVESGQLPRGEYYRECAKRVLNDKELKGLKVRETSGCKGYKNSSGR